MKKMPAPRPYTASLKLQVLQHLQLGEADVDAVDPGEQEQEDQERNQPPRDLAVHAGGIDGRGIASGMLQGRLCGGLRGYGIHD